ncbi:MAG: 16S rRNA (adenine(1518)-N(6)/adenine(1519)-N(6))-dimethyltransferase RsmA [Clostridia bacterium]|nr:16S rRNA (adenine(1518)-N(6)/adenine(1519)-N(6))-dimethyltransferase RsmA [Clostridia bacterium]
MLDLTNIEVIKYLCNKYGFKFSKDMGQNFLTDSTVIDVISASAAEDVSGVIEIGPGFGCLTAALGQRCKKVVSIELDRRLENVLHETLAGFDNIRLHWEDCMKADIKKIIEEEFDGRVSVAANLPYYITTPIVMKLLEGNYGFKKIIIMVQKEVAERFCATPGGKEYGAVTLGVQYRADARVICEVGKEKFIPSPKVDSAVIEMTLLDEPKVKPKSEKLFFSLIKAAFAQRRKTLVNSLSNAGCFGSKEDVAKAVEEIGKDVNIRGEKLSIEDFCRLADVLFDKKA